MAANLRKFYWNIALNILDLVCALIKNNKAEIVIRGNA